LNTGDRMILRNGELIPADAILVSGDASIDYSFVTGESAPAPRRMGDLLYAGGRQQGTVIEAEVVRPVSQSYLTQLWNDNHYEDKNEKSRFQQLVDSISHYFTIVLLAVAVSALAFWLVRGDGVRAWNAFTAVLIIACPCALAIASPFTLGNLLRLFGRAGLYLKNHTVIEKLARINTVVFDKTGTLTCPDAARIDFTGRPLNADEEKIIKSLVQASSHPLSVWLYKSLPGTTAAVEDFCEITGKGVSGKVFGVTVKVGSASFTGNSGPRQDSTHIYVNIDHAMRGYFVIGNRYRPGLEALVPALREKGYHLAILSGDHAGEKENLEALFGKGTEMHFEQSPSDKLRYILNLQRRHRNVLMVGDGLNDAGALRQSDAGITVSDDINNFSPACDGILDATQLTALPRMLSIARGSHRVILGSFAIALVYNVTGLCFAVTGTLSPLVAAVLMPMSAVTIISFTTGVSKYMARRRLGSLEIQPGDADHRSP
jgi:Cu+-exporting ATPase